MLGKMGGQEEKGEEEDEMVGWHQQRNGHEFEDEMVGWHHQRDGHEFEDEMVGWHHQLDGHELEKAPGAGDGQGRLACCSPWGLKESDTTQQQQRSWTISLLF